MTVSKSLRMSLLSFVVGLLVAEVFRMSLPDGLLILATSVIIFFAWLIDLLTAIPNEPEEESEPEVPRGEAEE